MGKLSELWAKLRETEDESKRKEIQQEINKVESWCIEKGFAGIKELTDWTKSNNKPTKKVYRFEGKRDGGLNIPSEARTGKDRCPACKFNNHSYCAIDLFDDHPGFKPCYANV